MVLIGRTSNLRVTENFVADLTRQQLALENSRKEISTGLSVIDPSDDAGRAGSIASLQNNLQRLDRYQQRISLATNLLEQQDGLLESAEQILVRAKEIATQGANETLGAQERGLLAIEVFELRDALVTLANSTVQGRYIYGAGDDDDPPFDASTYTNPATVTDPAHTRYVFDAEDGTSTTRTVQISDYSSIRVNSAGDGIFENAITSLERLGRALSGYRTTPEDLSGLPDGGGVAFTFPDEYTEQTADILECIDLIEDARSNDITVERSSVGGRLSRLAEIHSINDSVKINVETSRSAFQDADIIEAASLFQNLQVGLEGALATGASINRLSLLDFI